MQTAPTSQRCRQSAGSRRGAVAFAKKKDFGGSARPTEVLGYPAQRSEGDRQKTVSMEGQVARSFRCLPIHGRNPELCPVHRAFCDERVAGWEGN
jgi:hypothetical protein